jgi:ribosome-associated translation inhibitor RaiA
MTLDDRTEISFHGIQHSDALESWVHRRLHKLEHFADDIQWIQVTLESPHRQPHKGTLQATVEVSLRGDQAVAKREARPHSVHDNADANACVGGAIDAVAEQLEHKLSKRREQHRHEEGPQTGRIVRLNPEARFGFVETAGGMNLFFNDAHCEDMEFGDVEEGQMVRFAPSGVEGAYGPQVAWIKPVEPLERVGSGG